MGLGVTLLPNFALDCVAVWRIGEPSTIGLKRGEPVQAEIRMRNRLSISERLVLK
jgi:hypothetical protein